MSETNDNKEVNEQAEAETQEAEAGLSPEQEASDQEVTEASSEESETGADDAGSESSGGESAEDTEAASAEEAESEESGDGTEEGNSEEGSEESGEEEARSEPVEIPDLPQIIEGAVLAADKPLSIDHIIQLFPGNEPSRKQVREAIVQIQENCEGRGFEFKEVASGYRFQVRAEYGEHIGRLWEEKPPRYTRALLETLALIAYKQPITRGDIEEIRGVSVSTNIIRTLLEREWIRVVGHRDVPGRPSIYATTKTFLDYFNLSSLDELPTLSEIKDLDKVNEELELEGELIEPRTLNLEEEDQQAADTAADDESLDEVTDKVNQISENIKNLFKEPEEDDIDLDDDELDSEDAAASEDGEVAEAPEGNELEAAEAETNEAGDASTETNVDDDVPEAPVEVEVEVEETEETAQVEESEVAQAENVEPELEQSDAVQDSIQEEVTEESIEQTDATPEETSDDEQSEGDSASEDSPFKPQ